eukprot:1680400-Rhodomonas_salina.1
MAAKSSQLCERPRPQGERDVVVRADGGEDTLAAVALVRDDLAGQMLRPEETRHVFLCRRHTEAASDRVPTRACHPRRDATLPRAIAFP